MKPLARALALLRHLANHDGALTTAEGATLLETDKATALRDFETLAEAGWVSHVGEGRTRHWRLNSPTPVERLGLFDQISLRLGRDLASFLSGTGLARGVERVANDVDGRRSSASLDRKFVVHGEPARNYAE